MNFNVESRLSEIKSPTLVLSGDADVIVPCTELRNLAAKIPGAQLQNYRGRQSHILYRTRSGFRSAFIRVSKMTFANIIGTGIYVPEKIVTNDDLSRIFGEDINEFVTRTLASRNATTPPRTKAPLTLQRTQAAQRSHPLVLDAKRVGFDHPRH